MRCPRARCRARRGINKTHGRESLRTRDSAQTWSMVTGQAAVGEKCTGARGDNQRGVHRFSINTTWAWAPCARSLDRTFCTQARSRRKTTTTVTLSVAPWSRASPISRLAIMSGDLAVWRQQWTMRASSSTWRARRQRDQGFGRRLGEAPWLHHTAHAAVALLYSPGVARAQAGRAPRAASGHSPWGDNHVRASR